MTHSTPAGSLRPARTYTVAAGGADYSLADRDRTRPFLLLHGGGGPVTMTGFADLLAERTHSRVLLPTHPGFAGTPRPAGLATIGDLAAGYVALLDELDLSDVTVVGNSFGGWLALEIALRHSPRVSGAVVVDAIGAEVAGHPLTSVAGLSPSELVELSFHDPTKAPGVPAGPATDGPSPDVHALIGYAGPAMSDPTLLDRLHDVDIPVQVIWGASDGIVDTAHAEAIGAALPVAALTVLPRSGHMPQLETPEELLGTITLAGGASSADPRFARA